VVRNEVVAKTLAVIGAVASLSACSSKGGASSDVAGNAPICERGGGDCGRCSGPSCSGSSGGPNGTGPGGSGALSNDGIKNGAETDVDCGGPDAPKCGEGKSCLADTDCEVACNYGHKCVSAPSCKTHLGGDTCGQGEVDQVGATHESCCRSLPVSGFSDPAHPGKQVYLDKYEITEGRIRAWIAQLAEANGGVPDVKGWIAAHRPLIWDDRWSTFLPTDYEGGAITVARRLLGDPRPEDAGAAGPPGPGVVLPPATDQLRRLGINYQFGSEIYVDLHGMSCATWKDTYGFPTYYNPPDVLNRDGQLPRADGSSHAGTPIAANDLLDVKSMNCITNAMLAAFCAWDGGQLATDEVLDYVTGAPPTLGNVSGCGTQYDNHGELLKNIFTNTVQTGGRCAPVSLVNATFDAGDALPVPNSPLNVHNYHYPDTGAQTHDKAWQIAAPGRASLATGANGKAVDVVRINPNDEPWMDLNGNVSEAALDVSGATSTGLFALKYRGIAYGSSRSDLNVKLMKGETIARIQRPEAKGAFTGGRCMRFR
jgi:hypothetical protein